MPNNYGELVWITASTVAKVLICSVAGMFLSKYFKNKAHTEKGLTYISVRILLPLMLFSNLCLGVTWESVLLYYWAPIIALLPIFIGISGALVCRSFLNESYAGMLILGCTFQNGLTYPLSLLMNLKGVSWFGPEETETALGHVFLYNIVCSIGLWAVGEPIIKYYKSVEVRNQQAVVAAARQERAPAEKTITGSDNVPYLSISRNPSSSPTISNGPSSTVEQFKWYRPAEPDDEPINACAGAVSEQGSEPGNLIVAEDATPWSEIMAGVMDAMKSPTVSGSFLAIFISLVPPLRWIAETMPGLALINGFGLIGKGAIPLQLLVLGATVISNDTEENGAEESERDRTLWDRLTSQQSLFIISSIAIRLVIVPTICFGIIHLLSSHGIIPSNRIFLLAILVGTCSPSAINTSIICVIHDYHAKEYAEMIFVMYVSSALFSTFWLFIYVLYLS